jgi:predicted  nucleic acid-binding Zn-ribbon protein
MEDLTAAEERLQEMERNRTQALVELERLRTRITGRRARIEELQAVFGDTAARAAKRSKAATAATEAEAALNRAVRDRAAWREAAPDEARFAALESAAEAAEGARQKAEQALIDLRRTEAGIEGELKSDRADDVEARVSELAEACAVAQARVAGLEDEIGALQLLKREIDAAAGETRDRFAKPVMDRLGPYLALVFPDARARFGDGLMLDALERSGTAEDLGKLSDGTQEQLAVLARLGFGRLLAETGTPAPLILDDALVYADDARIERMFEALKLAAQSHQVLVLTCRERTFQSLGGHAIAIGAWDSSRAG